MSECDNHVKRDALTMRHDKSRRAKVVGKVRTALFGFSNTENMSRLLSTSNIYPMQMCAKENKIESQHDSG